MVFYLKYRPQKIEDLDSSSVRETLKAILSEFKPKKRELSFHAFLFTGPKGLGKTSTARIVAKFLNCENRKPGDLEPCNRCFQCKSIAAGNNLDLVEIDAASNRGIDEIRELKEKINLSTASAAFKVYIIDEVHMLTTEAFNALLKTLEEPPRHVVFILCTTEPHKVPATIVSRCLHISFRVATEEELVRSFKRIVSGEKLNVDKEALQEIAKLSDGSFRDGSKILQELAVKAKNKKITLKFAEENFKTVGVSSKTEELIGALEEKDTKNALILIQKAVDEGIDMRFLMEELLSNLHSNLIGKLSGENSKFTLEELKKLLELFMQASNQIKYAVLPQLPLELAIVEYCSEEQIPRGSVPLRPAGARSGLTAAPNELRAERESSRVPPLAQSPKASRASSGQSSSFLKELISKVDSQNKMIAGVLRGVTLKEINGKKVILETKSDFHRSKLKENKTIEMIEKLAREILNKNVKIEFLKVGD